MHGPYTVVHEGEIDIVGNRRWFEMERLQSWAGDVRDTVFVETGSGGGDCGYAFRLGGLYLVYASAGHDTVATGICARTRLWADAYEDSSALGAPEVDRTHGRPPWAFAPPIYCPIHRDVPVRRDHSIVVYGLGQRSLARWRQRAPSKSPYAGIQFEIARADSARTNYTDSYICASCRADARKWCRKQKPFLIVDGPRAWELRPRR